MFRALALIFAVVSTIVVGVLWLLWAALLWTARVTSVAAVWLFWGFILAAEMLLDAGYWLGTRIAGWLDRRDR